MVNYVSWVTSYRQCPRLAEFTRNASASLPAHARKALIRHLTPRLGAYSLSKFSEPLELVAFVQHD